MHARTGHTPLPTLALQPDVVPIRNNSFTLTEESQGKP